MISIASATVPTPHQQNMNEKIFHNFHSRAYVFANLFHQQKPINDSFWQAPENCYSTRATLDRLSKKSRPDKANSIPT